MCHACNREPASAATFQLLLGDISGITVRYFSHCCGHILVLAPEIRHQLCHALVRCGSHCCRRPLGARDVLRWSSAARNTAYTHLSQPRSCMCPYACLYTCLCKEHCIDQRYHSPLCWPMLQAVAKVRHGPLAYSMGLWSIAWACGLWYACGLWPIARACGLWHGPLADGMGLWSMMWPVACGLWHGPVAYGMGLWPMAGAVAYIVGHCPG